MNKKRIFFSVMGVGVLASVGLIAAAVVNGKYFEAVAISGIISVLAWFVLQGQQHSQQKVVEREEQAEVRER